MSESVSYQDPKVRAAILREMAVRILAYFEEHTGMFYSDGISMAKALLVEADGLEKPWSHETRITR